MLQKNRRYLRTTPRTPLQAGPCDSRVRAGEVRHLLREYPRRRNRIGVVLLTHLPHDMHQEVARGQLHLPSLHGVLYVVFSF